MPIGFLLRRHTGMPGLTGFQKKGEDDMYFISKEFSSKVLQQIHKRGLTTKLMLETTETS
jgi:hypothetical protein